MGKPAGQDANANGGGDPLALMPWLKDVPLHPLMAHPLAAMAATTAIGFGIAGQMAGAMLGMMQGAAGRARAALDETQGAAAPVKARPVLTVVPRAEAPAAEPKAAKAKPARKAPAARAGKADDLKAISGVGPKLEQVLNGMGLRRYADIAALKAADVARIDAELGLDGRIARDGWVEQAKALAKGRG